MSLVLPLKSNMHFPGSSSHVQRLSSCLEVLRKPLCFAYLWQCTGSLAPTRNDIWTSTSGPRPSMLHTFDSDMCFQPQRRASWDVNFQKCSDTAVFVHFDFEMCFAPQPRGATAASKFLTMTSQLPKVPRTCQLFKSWLRDVLRATVACNFSSLIWPATSIATLVLASGATNNPIGKRLFS